MTRIPSKKNAFASESPASATCPVAVFLAVAGASKAKVSRRRAFEGKSSISAGRAVRATPTLVVSSCGSRDPASTGSAGFLAAAASAVVRSALIVKLRVRPTKTMNGVVTKSAKSFALR